MSDFVLDQIAQNAMQQTPVSVHDNMVFEVNYQLVVAFFHSRLVEIHHLSHDRREVNRAAIQAKRASLCFRNIKCGVQYVQESIKAFDCVTDRIAPLFVGLTRIGRIPARHESK